MRVLITGGMGFIGRAVTRRLLETGCESIRIVDNLSEKIHGVGAEPVNFDDRRVSFCRADVCDREAMRPLMLEADTILHLAAETGTGQSMYDIDHYTRVNISATAMMIDLLTNMKHDVRRFVLASSRAVYGEGKYQCPAHGAVYPKSRQVSEMLQGDFHVKCPLCAKPAEPLATTEEAPMGPISYYGITKQFQETIALSLLANAGVLPVALRYQNVYGPGQSLINPYTGILSIFSNRIRSGKEIEIFEDGQESRDFVYIGDVAEATVKAMQADLISGVVLNVGSGIPVTVLSLAEKLIGLYKADVRAHVNGKFRVGDIRHNYADIARAEEVLGFRAKTSLDRGLEAFVAWVMRQKGGVDRYEASLEEMSRKGLYK